MTTSPLEHSLVTKLRTINQVLRVVLDRALEPHGLVLRELSVLAALSQTSGRSNAELARGSFMTPQAMNETVAAVESAKLLFRTADPENSRIRRARLTKRGERVLQDVSAELREIEAVIRRALRDDEPRLFGDLLDRATKALEKTAAR